jgi:hypothetical protein
MSEPWLDCPECGGDLFEPDAYGYFSDGDTARCECGALVRVSCDSESEPYTIEIDE